jgi:hypothetical protein
LTIAKKAKLLTQQIGTLEREKGICYKLISEMKFALYIFLSKKSIIHIDNIIEVFSKILIIINHVNFIEIEFN